MEGACIEVVCKVDLSTIHACMLGEIYRLYIPTGTDVLELTQVCYSLKYTLNY